MTCMADNVSNVSEVPSEARNLDGVQKARSQIRSVRRRCNPHFINTHREYISNSI